MKLQSKAGKKMYEDGYLTIFLALSITVLLSLILVLLEGARINAIRMKTETAGNIAVRSVLGEFHRELLRQYDLYFIDTSYGSGAGSLENVRQHLHDYMEKNLNSGSASAFGLNGDLTGTKLSELTVDSTRFAADDSARALREQVYAYMSADPAGGVLAEILSDTDTWQGLLEDGSVWEEERKEAGEELREGMREAKEEARKIREEVWTGISRIGDPIVQKAIYLHDIKGHTCEDTADIMHCSRTQVYRWRDSGYAELENILGKKP